MRYVTGTLLAGLLLLGLLGAQTAGAESAADVMSCSGTVLIPAGQSNFKTAVTPECAGEMHAVASINSAGRHTPRNVWVVGIHHYTAGYVLIRLNTAQHTIPMSVGWVAFSSP
jgi:hypothetical protein